MRLVIPAVLILTCAIPAFAAPQAGVIRVTATYPGADARTVDETVLAPLFSRISGVEGVTRIESEARNDGTGTVTVYFEPKADLNLAQVLVQSRANLALPLIPAPCRKLGMSVRKLPAGPPTFLLALTSADDKYDARFLGLYAMVHLKNELARIRGVADVRVVGSGEFDLRVLLNPDRLRAYRLTAGDVVDALRRQNARVATGTVGGALRYTVTASARLTTPDQFANVILRANPKGEILRLRDVAQVEFGRTQDGFARVNGKPAALIAVTAWTGRVTTKKLLGIDAAEDLPAGLRFEVVADRTADRLLEIEVQSPPASPASLERTEKIVGRATELIRGLPEKLGTVAFAEGRAPNEATILVKLPAKGGPTAAKVDDALAAIRGAAIRVGTSSPGSDAFPVRIALTAPLDWDEEPHREAVDRVGARLAKAPGVVSLARVLGPGTPQYAATIDRDKCGMLGIEFDDVFTTLQASLGGVRATDFSRFGRMWPVIVQTESRFFEDVKLQKVRSAAGEMVPLGKVLAFRKAAAPPTVVRVNGYRAIVFTAAPAAGKTPAEAAALCVKRAKEVLPRRYRVKDLTDPTR